MNKILELILFSNTKRTFQFKIKAWGPVPNAKADTIAPEAPRGLNFFKMGFLLECHHLIMPS